MHNQQNLTRRFNNFTRRFFIT